MRKEKRILLTIIILGTLFGSVGAFLYFNQRMKKQTLVISTTTSLYDTGLLDEIKNDYESMNPNVTLAFISAGTGIALEQAKRGDADLILVHAPNLEKTFMEEGFGVNRKIFAYNFFVLVGPGSDPAGINQTDPLVALQRIYEYGRIYNESIWISRDDRSGTNEKEKSLWAAAGYDYESLRNEKWFVSSGSGMGSTLKIASEQRLYTLSDIGTFLKYRSEEIIDLYPLVRESQLLLNVYSVIAVNATKVQGIAFDEAMLFIQYLTSKRGQRLIGEFGKESLGEALFSPAVALLEETPPPEIAVWIRNYAFFEVGGTLYECPPEWRIGDFDLYS